MLPDNGDDDNDTLAIINTIHSGRETTYRELDVDINLRVESLEVQ
jgi:hypothetical protein